MFQMLTQCRKCHVTFFPFFFSNGKFHSFRKDDMNPLPPFLTKKKGIKCVSYPPSSSSFLIWLLLPPLLDSHLHFLVFGTRSHSYAFFAFCTRRSLPKNIKTTLSKNRAIYSRLCQQIFYCEKQAFVLRGQKGRRRGVVVG